MEQLLGHQLGKYQLQAEIGRGGMAIVYRAFDATLERHVALKVLAPHLAWEQEFVQRFLREARAAARLHHPNIVAIYDVGQENNWYYFAMEYLEGSSLRDLIRQRGELPPSEVGPILRPLADALDYAHQEGIVHRDVKPANIIVSSRGRVTLTDFGIAKASYEGRLTGTGVSMGTPEYMAPEQILGSEVSAAADLYSLGVVAYEMLAGRPPFQADTASALIYQVVHTTPVPIHTLKPDLPRATEKVLAQAMAKEVRARYSSGTVFVSALEQSLAGWQGRPGGRRTPRPVAKPPGSVELPTTQTPRGELPTVAAPNTTAEAPTTALAGKRVATAGLKAASPPRGVSQVSRRSPLPTWAWPTGAGMLLALVVGITLLIQSLTGPAPARPKPTEQARATTQSQMGPYPTGSLTPPPTSSPSRTLVVGSTTRATSPSPEPTATLRPTSTRPPTVPSATARPTSAPTPVPPSPVPPTLTPEPPTPVPPTEEPKPTRERASPTPAPPPAPTPKPTVPTKAPPPPLVDGDRAQLIDLSGTVSSTGGRYA